MDERSRLALHPLPKEAFFSPTSPLTPTAKMFIKKQQQQPTPGRKVKKANGKSSPWSGTAKMEAAFFHHGLTKKILTVKQPVGEGILSGQHKPPRPPTSLSVASRGVLQTHLGDSEL